MSLAAQRHAASASLVILLGSTALLFARLGHYALWDDEAITAMTARAVWQTGDTSVRVDDHNLLVYRNGQLVRNFRDRYTPPLQFFVLAPILGLFGDSNLACRFPFALCGMTTVAIALRWLWRARPSPLLWWAAAFVILTNAEFFLFFRQCRYYGLATMLTTAAAYLYCHRTGRTRGVGALSAVLALLLASQYLNYAAAVACLAVDYALWGRKRRPIARGQWLVLLLPQLLVGGIVCSIWNPLAHPPASGVAHCWLADHLRLFWWQWRDAVTCDFAIVPLLLLCPLLYLRVRNAWLLRVPMALCVYLFVLAFAVPTLLVEANVAELRYLAPALPLFMAAAIVAVSGTLALKPRARWTVLALAAVSALVEPSSRAGEPLLWSSTLGFYRELLQPQGEPYTPAQAWVNANVPAGRSVYVEPGYMAYPLMLRAPGPVYAWQLTDPPRADFASLPPIHFHGRVAPDYVIAFGTSKKAQPAYDAMQMLAARGVGYERVATLPYYWQDRYRPERLWRTFTTTPPSPGNEVYVYRKAAGRGAE